MTLERAKVGLLGLAVVFLGIIAYQGTTYRQISGDVSIDSGIPLSVSIDGSGAQPIPVTLAGPVTLDPATTVGIDATKSNGTFSVAPAPFKAFPVTIENPAPAPVPVASTPSLPSASQHSPLHVTLQCTFFVPFMATTGPVSGTIDCP